MSHRWTRAKATEFATLAMQLGLKPSEAEQALNVGARFVAHGFTGHEIDQMILNHYRAVVERQA